MPTTRVLLDYKSGTFIAPEHRLQLGAYWGCPQAYQKADGLCTILAPADEAAVIHIGPDGIWLMTHLIKAELETAYARFLDARSLSEYLHRFDRTPAPPQRYVITGTAYTSVTQILSYVIAKPGLLEWYRKMGEAGKSPTAERDKKAVSGSTLHKAALFYLQGQAVDVSQNKDLESFMVRFATWCTQLNLKPEELETTVFHNREGYAGTLDALVQVDTARWRAWVETEQTKQAARLAAWQATQQQEVRA